MYLPNHFKESDPERLAALLRDYPFGMLVTMRDGLPFVSHIPFLYERRSDGVSVLLGHVAKANPQWRDLAQNQTALVVFQGPHGYVSPSWYESPGVPTWNYAAVHVCGKARVIDGADALEKLVEKFTAIFESTQQNPWQPNLSGERRAQLLGAIVGFEIEVQEMQGKFKLSQNRSAADQHSVIDHLSQSPLTSELAELMKAGIKPAAEPQ
jgi:transcriptional regulator